MKYINGKCIENNDTESLKQKYYYCKQVDQTPSPGLQRAASISPAYAPHVTGSRYGATFI